MDCVSDAVQGQQQRPGRVRSGQASVSNQQETVLSAEQNELRAKSLGSLIPRRWVTRINYHLGSSKVSRIREKAEAALALASGAFRTLIPGPTVTQPAVRRMRSLQNVPRQLLTAADMRQASQLLKKLTRKQADPCLYTYPFSVQSLVVHFAIVFALRAKHRPSRELTQLGYRLVNVDRNENLREWYLKVNPYGRVPTLTYSALPSPLTDALSIVYWICDQCPSLLPKAHQTEICRLLSQLHEALDRYGAANPTVDDLLTNHDITPTHRKALEYKRDCQRKQRELVSMNLSDGQSMTAQSTSFLNEIVELREKYSKGGTWIFGDKVGPTVLDAHVVPFVTRLDDIHLDDLVPDQLRKYAQKIRKLPQGKEAMGQRPTVWDASLGPIDEIRL